MILKWIKLVYWFVDFCDMEVTWYFVNDAVSLYLNDIHVFMLCLQTFPSAYILVNKLFVDQFWSSGIFILYNGDIFVVSFPWTRILHIQGHVYLSVENYHRYIWHQTTSTEDKHFQPILWRHCSIKKWTF